MGFKPFHPAKRPGTGVPNIQSLAYTTGQTFITGAPLVAVAAGTYSECGADPTDVAGVALEPAGSRPGYDMANSPTVVTGRKQEVTTAIADNEQYFAGVISGDGLTVTVPTQTLINERYGIAKAADGVWYVDSTDTTNDVVEITDIDTDRNLVIFKFLPTVIATAVA